MTSRRISPHAFVLLAASILLSGQAMAQSVSVGNASGLPGESVNLNVSYSAGGGVSTLQFDLTYNSNLSYVSVSTGSAASAAGKTASANPISGGVRILIFGLNQTAIASGTIATVRLTISSGAPAGPITVSISHIVASDGNGDSVSTSGSGGTVTVNAVADTTPPVISGIGASGITYSGATVSWTTNEASNSQVDYGLTASYGSSTTLNSSLVTSHSQSLSGLSASTLYHYRVKSRDAAGNLATSGDRTFTTSAAPDTTAPTFSNVRATNVTATGATIAWSTNESSDSQVDYGLTASYGSSTNLNTSRVTSHSQNLTGLAAGTAYHYRVRSRDAAGNLGTSGDYTFTTATLDTTPPVISGVSASGTTATSTTIRWSTNEESDTEVEYGTTTSYGSTSRSSSMATLHSRSLTGLVPNTVYHFRVKSRDEAGNQAVSGDATFQTEEADTTPPVISGVAVSSLTASGALVSWTTNEPSDSQIEYGTTTSYGSATSIVSTRVTGHSMSLAGLSAETVYHFRVKSRDESGNLAISQDGTFTTSDSVDPGETEATMYLPRLVSPNLSEPGAAAPDYLGMAVANLDTKNAVLTFTAYDTTGNPLAGPGITNPVSRNLAPGQQLPIVDSELFGQGVTGGNGVGWVKIESTVARVAGFFLMFNGDLSMLDGANVATAPVTSFILPEIEDQGFTRLDIANTNATSTTLHFDLMKADGTVRESASRDVGANGAFVADLYSDLFPGQTPAASDYVKVRATQGVMPFELVGKASRYVEGLNGQSTDAGGTTLYSPQYVVGGPWRSTLSIVNLDSTAGSATIKLIGDDGVQIGPARSVNLAAGGKAYIDDQAFFHSLQVPPANVVTQGYVEITSSGIRLAGSVVFGDPERQTFSTALPLVSGLQNSILFSQVASDQTYFTGMSILNPDAAPAIATIDVYRADGTRDRSVTQTIPGKNRITKVLTELFPSLTGVSRSSGYIRITVDKPVAGFALFGTHDLSVLSAVPPQVVP